MGVELGGWVDFSGREDAVYLGFKSLAMTACFSCLKLSAIVAVYYGFLF